MARSNALVSVPVGKPLRHSVGSLGSVSAATIEELLEAGCSVRLPPGFSLQRLEEFADMARTKGAMLHIPAAELTPDAVLRLSRKGGHSRFIQVGA
jgi:hypothetical protein